MNDFLVNGYEDAVSTKMLATHCMACSRALRDAKSVELGIGPICRAKYFPGAEAMLERPDAALFERALAMAPAAVQLSIAPLIQREDYQGAANKAVWHAAMAVSYTGPQGKQVLAAAQQIIKGCGFPALSERVKEFHFRSQIAIEQVGRDRIGARTPYNDAFVAAVKKIQGRRWDGGKRMWTVPNDKVDHLVAALSAGFPDQIMSDLQGNMVKIPRDAQFPPPKTKPAGAPDIATGETDVVAPEQLAKLKKGDSVIVEGTKRKIGWIDHRSGRVGLIRPGQRGFEFISLQEVKLESPERVAAAQKKDYESDARDAAKAEAPAPPISAPARAVPAVAYPYQKDGVAWLDQKRRGLLADEPGLGKTLQAAVAIDSPCLVVCPAAMRVEWVREIGKWRSDLTTLLATGKKAYTLERYKSADVVIINYDILGSHLKALCKLKTCTLIADEAHMAKTLKLSRGKYQGSARAKALQQLANKADRVFLLTATPIMNRPIELWPLLHMIDPDRWDSYSAFGKRYCDGRLEERVVRGGRVQRMWNFTGSSNGRELNALLTSQFMLRRTKDILDLPEKTRQSHLVSLEPKVAKEYDKAAKEFLRWVEANGGADAVKKAMTAEALTKMTALRHLAGVGKVPYATDWIINHFEATRRPLVVMAHHRDVTLGIEQAIKELPNGEPRMVEGAEGPRQLRVGKIIGGMSEAKRTADKDAFQAGQLDVLVCSIQAAGVGLTLTAASETLFVERAWRPADLVQAEDRIWRIGQPNKCTIFYLDAANTIDEAVATLLIDKRSTFAQVIDGVDVDDDEAADLVLGVMFGLAGQKGVKMPRRGLTGGSRVRSNPDEGYQPLVEWMGASLF